ncbi:hypothetical protein ACF0H5_004923 [Mactra antiquata]
MAQILRDLHSPVSVTITRPRSPGVRLCQNTIIRTHSAESRNGQSGSRNKNFLGHDLNARDRSASPRRSNSARGRQPCLLEVPNKNCQSNKSTDDKRSRSHSPLDWIHREKMPSCSPTFERVLSDMLSETEISPQTSDAENEQNPRQNTKQKKTISRRKRVTSKRK